jgi:hypothetical protein
VKHGRFSESEKATIRQAVQRYAAAQGLSVTDLGWLFATRKEAGRYRRDHPGAWQAIADSLPHRTTQAVWACGTRMLHPDNYQVCMGSQRSPPFIQSVGQSVSRSVTTQAAWACGTRMLHPDSHQVRMGNQLSPLFIPPACHFSQSVE